MKDKNGDIGRIPDNSLISLNSQPVNQPWIDPAPEVFYGLPGAIIDTLEPHTEADRMALLVQLLAAVGNVIGKEPHFRVEDDCHSLKIYPVLVGKTSKGRKGTSWSRIKYLFKQVTPEWLENCVVDGLSSGEGLIWAVRDPIPASGNNEAVSGISDKRLFVLEPEFAIVLKRMQGQLNTLSAVIRQSWDSDHLRSLTKNSPARATGAHITIVGHITSEELIRHLDCTELANGFANRFLWIGVRRSKVLPEGGLIPETELQPLIERMRSAINFASGVREIKRDDQARELWREAYPFLSNGLPGMIGALTARAEAYVMRIACIYALLDSSPLVLVPHLKAALAIWDYSEYCVRQIFGKSLGDPIADTISRNLTTNNNGLTRTQISGLFGRHTRSTVIDSALSVLEHCGMARRTIVRSTGGRNEEHWFAAAK